jgi:eukaryotic-like serine/threonine-protein kinase
MVGKALTHYQILDMLGQGGMGVVYKARDSRLNRLVALKILPPEKIRDLNRRARFIQEARAASALNHPNIITIYEIDSDGDTDFMVMELVSGKTLDEVIGRHGLKLTDTLRYSIQIADALAAAHAAGIVHRDLKPGNVMITDNGVVKVLDFGLAKLMEPVTTGDVSTETMKPQQDRLTEVGVVMGTVAYMSPEQAEGTKIDARSDIFSFGSLLYEMSTGQRPFQGESKMSLLLSIMRDDPKPPRQLVENLPRDLEKIILRCLRKDRARRFQHMDDVKICLEELYEEFNSGRLEASDTGPLTGRSQSRWQIYAAVAATVALGAALTWQFSRSSETRSNVRVRQLTQDAGLAAYPVLSPDGKLLAYSSDRAGETRLDIWVQQLTPGARPIRLTNHRGNETYPSFSPDGGLVAYQAFDGIYVKPALGGEERMLGRMVLGRSRFSPDGQWLLAGPSYPIPGNPMVILPSSGGAPRHIVGSFFSCRFPVWSPDGKMILFTGQQGAGSEAEWWVVPSEGGTPVKTGASSVLPRVAQGLDTLPEPMEWLDGYVLFADKNLWRLPISQSGKITGKPEALTAGSGNEMHPRAISVGKAGRWRTVFGNISSTVDLWSLPIDQNSGKLLGEPVRLIPESASRMTPSSSLDGAKLVYVLQTLDGYAVRALDGAERTLVQSRSEMRAKISPDGAMVAFNPTVAEKESAIHLIAFSGGESRELCDTCGLIYDWSPDGKNVIYRSGQPIRFSTVDVESGRQEVILNHPKLHIHAAKYSPDSRWIAFHYAAGSGTPPGIFVAPARNGKAGPQEEWIRITNSGIRPWWSPDGNSVYFMANGISRQRLDPVSKKPAGAAIVVYQPPGERLRFNAGAGHRMGPAVIVNRLVFPLSETTGNIWIAEEQ